MSLTRKQRQQVWNKSGGKCWYCGCDLPEKGWHADHFLPIGREIKYTNEITSNGFTKIVPTGKLLYPKRDVLKNLVPSCASCNIWKGGMAVETFRQTLEDTARTVLNTNTARTALRYGLIEVKPKPVIFWFEKHRQEQEDSNEIHG